MILVHAAPASLERHRHPALGVLSSPRRFYTDVDGWPWAADNDAYSAWDEDRYVRMLRGIADLPRPLFVTCPDIVGDGPGTLALFRQWMPALHGLGLPAGLVAQDGMTAGELDWPLVDAVFIGGTDGFKMGPEAAEIGREAKRRGLWLHMGRVNGHRRVMYAKAIGCDSVDGSSLTWFKDRWLARFLEHAHGPTQETFL